MLGYTITQWLFGVLSLMAIMFALMVVFTRNPVNSVLYLVLTFFCIAGHYLLLNAQFFLILLSISLKQINLTRVKYKTTTRNYSTSKNPIFY